jgi:hypothetical protein
VGIVNLFTKQAPTIAGYSFDAVLEDTFEATVEVTTYPIESGVRVSDHRILQPFKWSMVGAVSNNPLSIQLTDFLGGALSNLTDNPLVASIAGLSAGFLAGSDQTRASTTLQFLIKLMQSGDPFDIDAGDIILYNMVITRISRTKDPVNEGGLIFIADLQELITLDRLSIVGAPTVNQLRDADQSKSALARAINRGQKMVKDVKSAVAAQVDVVLGSIF